MKLFGYEITRANRQKALVQEMQTALVGMFANGQIPQMLVPNYDLYTKGKANNVVYATNADVYSIIRLISKTAAMVPLYVYVVKDEKALRKYKDQAQKKDYSPEGIYRLKELQTKAMEMAGDSDELQKLIDAPNTTENKQDFYEKVYGFRLMDGNSFIYMPTLELGANAGKIQGMYAMPPQYTYIIATQGFPKMILGYELIMNGVKMLETKEVIHLKYWNPNYTASGAELYGLSPLRAGYKTVARSDSAKDNSVAQFQQGGPSWILANKNITADQNSISLVGQVKKKYEQEYAGPDNAGKGMFMAGDIQYERTGLSPVDLNILESEKFTLDQLCNLYGIDSVLLNNHEAGTDNNVGHMVRRLYTNAVLPEVFAVRDSFNAKLVPQYSGKGVKKIIDCDITGINELQPDMKATAEWLNASWWITPNQKLEVQKFGKYNDPTFDEPWIPTGFQPLSEALIQVDPLPNDPNNPNNLP